MVETGTEVIGMSGDGHLECLTLKTPRGEERRAGEFAVHLHRRRAQDRLAAETRLQSTQRLHPCRPRSQGQGAGNWKLDREPYLLETSVPGVFVAGDVRYNSSQAMCLRGWRGLNCSSVRASIPSDTLKGITPTRTMSEQSQVVQSTVTAPISEALFTQLRATSILSSLRDDEIRCLGGFEEVRLEAGRCFGAAGRNRSLLLDSS